ASFGLTGRSIVSPTLFLNSTAIVEPSTTSPLDSLLRFRPCAVWTFSTSYRDSPGSLPTIWSGRLKFTTFTAPGLARNPYEGKPAPTPPTCLSSSSSEGGRIAACPSGGPPWMLAPKYLPPPLIKALKCSASAPIVVSANMPMTIPRIVRVLRSLRRARFRRISMLHSHLRCRLATPEYERTIPSRRSLARQNRGATFGTVPDNPVCDLAAGAGRAAPPRTACAPDGWLRPRRPPACGWAVDSPRANRSPDGPRQLRGVRRPGRFRGLRRRTAGELRAGQQRRRNGPDHRPAGGGLRRRLHRARWRGGCSHPPEAGLRGAPRQRAAPAHRPAGRRYRGRRQRQVVREDGADLRPGQSRLGRRRRQPRQGPGRRGMPGAGGRAGGGKSGQRSLLGDGAQQLAALRRRPARGALRHGPRGDQRGPRRLGDPRAGVGRGRQPRRE